MHRTTLLGISAIAVAIAVLVCPPPAEASVWAAIGTGRFSDGTEGGYIRVGDWKVSCNKCHAANRQPASTWTDSEFERHKKAIFPKREFKLAENKSLKVADLILTRSRSGLEVKDTKGRRRATLPIDTLILKNEKGEPQILFSPSDKKFYINLKVEKEVQDALKIRR